MTFPVRFDPAFNPERTNLLSRMVQEWAAIPAVLLERLNLRKLRYGFIGLKDRMMSPLVRPGSFVQIEEQRLPIQPVRYHSEFDRPIWFLELRDVTSVPGVSSETAAWCVCLIQVQGIRHVSSLIRKTRS